MEILFENKYIRDKEWAKDAYSWAYFRRPIIIAVGVICVLYLSIGIYDLITIGFFEWTYIVVPVALGALVAINYSRSVNMIIKRDVELHGKTVEVTVKVSEDIIKISHSTGLESHLNYYDIKKAVRTKKFIYLWSKTNILYSFKRDSFSLGTADEFLLFLKNKGIKVK